MSLYVKDGLFIYNYYLSIHWRWKVSEIPQLLMMIRAQQQRRFIDINALRINQTLHFNIVSSFFSYGHTNMIQVHMRIY